MSGLEYFQQWCPMCGRHVMAVRPKANHTLHALLTLFLCGCWAPMWLILHVKANARPFQCQTCGSITVRSAPAR